MINVRRGPQDQSVHSVPVDLRPMFVAFRIQNNYYPTVSLKRCYQDA